MASLTSDTCSSVTVGVGIKTDGYGTTGTTSAIRAAIQELKKKTSAITPFAGLTATSSDHSEPCDKSDQSGETVSSGKACDSAGSVIADGAAFGYSEDMDGFKWNIGPDAAGPTAARSSKAGHISLGGCNCYTV